ncbi:MAG: HlyD family efflux transporter periplasmic adaptor subunit [Phycisphaerae bacterium]|nr:HlyD family efflux transporter periplasmic adaptor subunit [Phycisphaerae bacterium]
MSQIPNNPAASVGASSKGGGSTVTLQAALRALARKSPTPAVAWNHALRIVSERFSSQYATVFVRLGVDTIEDETHIGPTDPAFWREAVREFQTLALADGAARARMLSARGAALRVALLSAPLTDADGALSGAITLVTRVDDAALEPRLASLEAMAALLSHLFGRSNPSAPAAAASEVGQSTSTALSKAAAYTSATELAYALTNGIRNKLGCEQTALAIVRRGDLKLLSISGLDDVRARTPGVIALRAAMEECLDFGKPIVHQDDSAWDGARLSDGHLLHERWHELAGRAAVATIPLRANDEIQAVFSIRFRSGEQITQARLDEVAGMVVPFAGALQLLQRARRGVIEHTLDAWYAGTRSLFLPGRIGRKLATAAAILGVLWFCFWTMNYELRVRAAIGLRDARQVVMPYDGRVAESLKRAGDTVAADEVICRLDTRDLVLQRSELAAQFGVAEQQRLAALAAGEPVEARAAEAAAELAQSRLAIIDRRIEQATIRAPFAGTVVSGDLREMVDASLKQGTPLLVLSPAGARRVELRVPDHAARDLQSGLRGRFAGSARPDDARALTITRVRPAAEPVDGENVVLVEADADLQSDWLRPGMEGVARIEIGRRPVWWICLHRAIDWMRMNYWL